MEDKTLTVIIQVVPSVSGSHVIRLVLELRLHLQPLLVLSLPARQPLDLADDLSELGKRSKGDAREYALADGGATDRRVPALNKSITQ
jgi:hypothetical protein